jgi:dephospho-CoA kinase
VVVIGLTGGIGAGKSTFAGFLGELGAHVIDVDAIGRAVLAEGGPAAAAVLARFGTLDRREIAKVVFGDEAARRDLEAISWPAIDAELARLVAAQPPDGVVVLDMAVLAQGDLGKGLYGPVVTVEAAQEDRVQRLIGRGMAEEDARARMAAQVPEQVRRDLADVVVVNDGDLGALAAAARDAWAALVPDPSCGR